MHSYFFNTLAAIVVFLPILVAVALLSQGSLRLRFALIRDLGIPIGIVCSLIGMTQMIVGIGDANVVGPATAVMLLTIFYGGILSAVGYFLAETKCAAADHHSCGYISFGRPAIVVTSFISILLYVIFRGEQFEVFFDLAAALICGLAFVLALLVSSPSRRPTNLTRSLLFSSMVAVVAGLIMLFSGEKDIGLLVAANGLLYGLVGYVILYMWCVGRPEGETINAPLTNWHWMEVIALEPDYAKAHYNLGITLTELGKLDDAETSYRKAIALKPDYAEAHNNMGNTLRKLDRLDDSEASLRKAVALKPDFAEAHNNLGITLAGLGRLDEAEASLKKAVDLKPDYAEAYYNLGNTLKKLGRLDEAEASYRQAIALKPHYAEAHTNLGITLKELGRLHEAEASYREAIALEPDYAEAHYNLGITINELGKLDDAEASYNQAIALKPDYAEAHNNLGITLQELGKLDEALASYNQAIVLKPDYADAYWNLHGIQENIQGAEHWIDRCLQVNENHIEARLTRAALRFYQGDRTNFDELMQSEMKQHPSMRSFSWVFSLPSLPELHFDKWRFFDAVVKKSITSKPFYEFGVWRASSFRYLLKVYKKGYGFDTFTGLPEDWHVGSRTEKKGTYTSDGNVPKIEGGEFIVGKFEDTLPVFFSESRPTASVINFDADLYSSTICALNFSKSVMDKNTILIFDELIINESWEEDEFKALNEFCSINHYSYEVLAVSFHTKQVAVKLIGM